MNDEERVRLWDYVNSTVTPVERGQFSTAECWSCRYREADFNPARNADCLNPLVLQASRKGLLPPSGGSTISQKWCPAQRSENGLCGPNALLYRHPRWYQIIRWVRWLFAGGVH